MYSLVQRACVCRRREDVPVADGDQGRRVDAGHLLQRCVAQNRLGLVAKRVHGLRMGVFGRLPLELDEGLRVLGVVARREHPQPDLARQLEHRPSRVAIACQLRISATVYGSASHHGQWMASERTTAGCRTAICCAIMPAHRGSDDVGALDLEVTEQRDGDVGEQRGRVRAAGPLRLADPRVVEDDDAE